MLELHPNAAGQGTGYASSHPALAANRVFYFVLHFIVCFTLFSAGGHRSSATSQLPRVRGLSKVINLTAYGCIKRYRDTGNNRRCGLAHWMTTPQVIYICLLLQMCSAAPIPPQHLLIFIHRALSCLLSPNLISAG